LGHLSFFCAFEPEEARWCLQKRAMPATYQSPSCPTPWTDAALRGSATRLCAKTTLFLGSRPAPWSLPLACGTSPHITVSPTRGGPRTRVLRSRRPYRTIDRTQSGGEGTGPRTNATHADASHRTATLTLQRLPRLQSVPLALLCDNPSVNLALRGRDRCRAVTDRTLPLASATHPFPHAQLCVANPQRLRQRGVVAHPHTAHPCARSARRHTACSLFDGPDGCPRSRNKLGPMRRDHGCAHRSSSTSAPRTLCTSPIVHISPSFALSPPHHHPWAHLLQIRVNHARARDPNGRTTLQATPQRGDQTACRTTLPA